MEAFDFGACLSQGRGERGRDLLVQRRAFEIRHRLIENLDGLRRFFLTQAIGTKDCVEHFAAQPVDLHLLTLGSDVDRPLRIKRSRFGSTVSGVTFGQLSRLTADQLDRLATARAEFSQIVLQLLAAASIQLLARLIGSRECLVRSGLVAALQMNLTFAEELRSRRTFGMDDCDIGRFVLVVSGRCLLKEFWFWLTGSHILCGLGRLSERFRRRGIRDTRCDLRLHIGRLRLRRWVCLRRSVAIHSLNRGQHLFWSIVEDIKGDVHLRRCGSFLLSIRNSSRRQICASLLQQCQRASFRLTGFRLLQRSRLLCLSEFVDLIQQCFGTIVPQSERRVELFRRESFLTSSVDAAGLQILSSLLERGHGLLTNFRRSLVLGRLDFVHKFASRLVRSRDASGTLFGLGSDFFFERLQRSRLLTNGRCRCIRQRICGGLRVIH